MTVRKVAMDRLAISTTEAPGPGVGAPTPAVGTYSLGIAAAGLIFVSGQGGIRAGTGVLVDGIEAQTELALANIEAILRAAGSSLDRVVKFGVFLADINEWGAMNRVFERVLSTPYPARITVQAALAEGMRIEADAIALAP
jgi:2-iminobutanoate/2-iminopropanoate deaminase